MRSVVALSLLTPSDTGLEGLIQGRWMPFWCVYCVWTMKRLRSDGILSDCLLHGLRSGHVSRGQSRGRRPLLPMKWNFFFLFLFTVIKIGQGFSIKRWQPSGASTETKGIEVEAGEKKTLKIK